MPPVAAEEEVRMEKRLILSVGREFGSGGHVIAEALARRFELDLYDNNLLEHVAEEKSVGGDTLKKYDERPKSRLFSRTVRGYSNSIQENVANMQFAYLKKLAEAGIFLLMLFVSVVLLTRDYDKMAASLEKYRSYQFIHRITQRMWKQGGMYLKAQMILILITIILCAAGLWIFGNPYFLLLGIVIGLLDALPFIGTGTVLVPMAAFLVFRGNYKLAAGYAGLFLLTYVVREYLEPRLIGAKLGVYPFVMVVVVYAGLYLYGPAGVFLGPVTLLMVMEITREIYNKNEEE